MRDSNCIETDCNEKRAATAYKWIQFLDYLTNHLLFSVRSNSLLTLPTPYISESRIKKINLNFYFHTSLWCLKGFYEDQPFEAPEASVKIKSYDIFFLFVRDWGGKG